MAAFSSVATFTPAATSHVAGDNTGAAQEFVSIGPRQSHIMITSAALMIDSASVEATAWRLQLYNITPPSAYADDAPWDILTGDRASYLGYVDLGTAVDIGGTQWVETNGINKHIRQTSMTGSLFAYLNAVSTVTPAAVAHRVTLYAIAI